jgi:hypothetical protein
MSIIKEHNVETGEVIEREMTAQEIANLPSAEQSTPSVTNEAKTK